MNLGCKHFFFQNTTVWHFYGNSIEGGMTVAKATFVVSFFVYLRYSRLSLTFMIFHDLGEKERPAVYSQAPKVVARD